MGKLIEYLPAKSNGNTAFTNAQTLSKGSFDVSKYKDFIPVIVVSTSTSPNDDSKQKETVNQNLSMETDSAFYFPGKNLNVEILESLMKNPFNLDRLEKVIKYDAPSIHLLKSGATC